MTSHIWWLGLKYVSSQRTFCGLYVVILTSYCTHLDVGEHLDVLLGDVGGLWMEPVSGIDKDCIVSLMSPVLKRDKIFHKFQIRPVSKETRHNIDNSHKRGRACLVDADLQV